MFQTVEPGEDGYTENQRQTISRIEALLAPRTPAPISAQISSQISAQTSADSEPAGIMNVRGNLPDSFDWEDGHLAEILLAYVRPQYQLREAILLAQTERQHVGLEDIDLPPAFEKLTAFAEANAEEADTFLTHNEWKSLRQHLATLIRHNKREAAQKHLKRDYGKLFARRQAISVIIVVLLFALVLFFGSGFYSASTRHFSGLIIATSAGLLGASLSQLRTPLSDFEHMTVAAATVMRRFETILIRNIIGGTAAVALYFFFQADVVEGSLFPDLSKIGFTRLGVPCDQGKPVGCTGLNGGFVPNSDLSKLFVWSIVAGFSEKLVPSLLDRVSDSTNGKPSNQ